MPLRVQAVWLPVPTTHSPPKTPTSATLVTQNVQFALVQLQPSVHSATRPTCSATLLVMPPVLRVMVRPTRPLVCSVMPSALLVSSLLTIARPVQRVVLTRRSWTQIWLILSVRRPALTLHSSPTLRLTSVTPVTLVVHPVALPVITVSVVKLATDGSTSPATPLVQGASSSTLEATVPPAMPNVSPVRTLQLTVQSVPPLGRTKRSCSTSHATPLVPTPTSTTPIQVLVLTPVSPVTPTAPPVIGQLTLSATHATLTSPSVATLAPQTVCLATDPPVTH